MKKTEQKFMQTVDETDLQILSMLCENARISLKSMAENTFLSSTAISSRIEKLEQNGYIKGYSAKLNPQVFGLNIKAFINVEVDPIRKQDFYPYIRSCKNVVECDCVTGEYSMILKVVFASTDELDRFINEIQRFGKTKTQIVFSTPIEARELYFL